MKIAFCGSQGTGKTTIAYKLAYKLKRAGHDVYVLSEVARSCPLPINEETTREAQLWIMGKQMTREQSAKGKIYVSDRTLLDSFAYAIRKDPEFFEPAKQFIKNYMTTYDFIFYMEPNDNYLMNDGTRSTDKKFRDDIDNIMKSLIDELDIDVIKTRNVDDMFKQIIFELTTSE